MADIIDPGAPEPPVESSVYGDEESTYLWWVESYGRAEAERLADAAGIPVDQRRLWGASEAG
jgi:hypothetical protein